jgi:hypothetical protein
MSERPELLAPGPVGEKLQICWGKLRLQALSRSRKEVVEI